MLVMLHPGWWFDVAGDAVVASQGPGGSISPVLATGGHSIEAATIVYLEHVSMRMLHSLDRHQHVTLRSLI